MLRLSGAGLAVFAVCCFSGLTLATAVAAADPRVAGRLGNPAIDEASGIVHSPSRDNVFWVVNDSGDALLYALDDRGHSLGRVRVAGAGNVDWEDIAAFELDGRPFLTIADIGDNEARREDVRVYVVPEPDPGDDEVAVAWQLDFRYPGGPRDAESLAVDAAGARILVLTKRDIPAELYALPLRSRGGGPETAIPLGVVDSLPQPGRQDIESAAERQDWWWQPTAMDFAADGRAAVILTYRGVYLYRRCAQEDWRAALQRRPETRFAGDLAQAESVAFGADDASVYITFEGSGAPLLGFDLPEPGKP
jgi:hypothetical protein